MIDIEAIRKEPEKYKKAARDKGITVNIERLLELDQQIRYTKGLLQRLTERKKALQKTLPTLSDSEKAKAIQTLQSFKNIEVFIRKGPDAYLKHIGLP